MVFYLEMLKFLGVVRENFANLSNCLFFFFFCFPLCLDQGPLLFQNAEVTKCD